MHWYDGLWLYHLYGFCCLVYVHGVVSSDAYEHDVWVVEFSDELHITKESGVSGVVDGDVVLVGSRTIEDIFRILWRRNNIINFIKDRVEMFPYSLFGTFLR